MEAINQLSETKLISLDITEAKLAVVAVVCSYARPQSICSPGEYGGHTSILAY